ncbi:MAG: cardiolipin synthase [bacterium]|nr:cardiolipin synthase [bacterium]
MSDHISAKVRHKSRRLLFRILFSRTMITFLLLLIQILVLFGVFYYLNPYREYYIIGFNILSAVLVVYMINMNGRPEFKLAWMVPLCVFPLFGVLLYLFVKINPGAIGLKKEMQRTCADTEKYLETEPKIRNELETKEPHFSDLSYYLEHTGKFPTYQNTAAKYYASGEEAFVAIQDALERAEKFIFIEFFIISEGIMWNTVLEILKKKAEAGVEVRVMYDGTCTVACLPYSYPKRLRRMGLKAKMYAPIRPFLSTHQNNRDHRKIIVVDGKIGFTGGINLADEYINEKNLYGHWKDTAIRIEGDAVKSMTAMYLQMWNASEPRHGGDEAYFHVTQDTIKDAEGYIVPYGDGPTNDEDVAEDIYRDLLNKSRRYVHIMTPYLILDHEMLSALCFAAKRGVEVELILPHVPDKTIPFYIARTYYETLNLAGVRVYEYEPGFLHAKSFVSDDEKAVVGSINLDYRSLYHHFECAVYAYKNSVIDDIEQDFQKTKQKSILMTQKEMDRIPIIQRIIGSISKIFGPLM